MMSQLIAFIDGGSRGNPGPAAIGVVIEGAVSGPIKIAKWIGCQDSNVAEYVALLEALQCALSLKAKRLHVYSDSEVVVKQMTGVYKCKSPRLYSLNWTCRKLARSVEFSISHIRRQLNSEANSLVGHAILNAVSVSIGVQSEVFRSDAFGRAMQAARATKRPSVNTVNS